MQTFDVRLFYIPYYGNFGSPVNLPGKTRRFFFFFFFQVANYYYYYQFTLTHKLK